MLDRKELKEIALLHDDSPRYVSLYLNVNPLSNPRGEFTIWLKNKLKKAPEFLDKAVYKLVRDDLSKMESYVSGNKKQFKKGLVLLSSSGNAFWKEYHLSVPVKSDLIVDKSPYVKPLLDVLDNYERYAVLLVDKVSARIFVIHLGEIVEYGEVHTPDVPGRHKKGGWFALSQDHYERHIDYHVSLHLKDVLEKFDSFLSGEHIGRVVIGGSDEAVTMVKGMLHKTVLDRVIGSVKIEMLAKNDEVLSKSEKVIRFHEQKMEDETVESLVNQAMKNNKAVLGIENVLHALQTGNVMKLVYIMDFNSPGFVCRNCRSFALQERGECPYCGGGMEKTDYVVDVAAQKALEQGAEVEAIGENKKLSVAGGIGAFLRF